MHFVFFKSRLEKTKKCHVICLRNFMALKYTSNNFDKYKGIVHVQLCA